MLYTKTPKSDGLNRDFSLNYKINYKKHANQQGSWSFMNKFISMKFDL